MTSFLRAHPVFVLVTAIATLVGTAAIYAGTVGAVTAARRTAQAGSVVPGQPPVAAATPDQPSPSVSTSPSASGAAVGRRAARTEPARCGLSRKLVPTCGVLWGVAPGAYTDLRPSRALADFEEKTGRAANILHEYHRGDELFPTADEIAASRQGGQHRLLLVNWKVAWGTTWADVAAGGQDARIDRLAGYLKRTYRDPFYLAIHHEPENDVNTDPASGMTARDYAAMFRHTVTRLRADGIGNAVFVMVYMAYQPWCVQPWFDDLWPGDDVVDWVGFDPYVYAAPDKWGHGDFGYLVDRTSDRWKWPGFYTWVTQTHGNKPLMVAEWGVYEDRSDPAQKAWIFSTVAGELRGYPAIKALVYFESPAAPKGDTRPDSSEPALDQYRKLAESAVFGVHVS